MQTSISLKWKPNLPHVHQEGFTCMQKSRESVNCHDSCHISHCEIKFHRIWPSYLEANSQKIFPISQNFHPNTFYEAYFVVFITSVLHLNKGLAFWLFWGSSKVIFAKISQNFIKSPLKFCFNSLQQISVHSLWKYSGSVWDPSGTGLQSHRWATYIVQ